MIYNDYIFNRNFRKYVDSYCQEHGVTVHEALKVDEVKRAWRRYTEV